MWASNLNPNLHIYGGTYISYIQFIVETNGIFRSIIAENHIRISAAAFQPNLNSQYG